MSQAYKVDFATFCHAGDAHRLHAPGQLKRQVESNNYPFSLVHVVYQKVRMDDWQLELTDQALSRSEIQSITDDLVRAGIDIFQPQYQGDHAHEWQYHVVNHLHAIERSFADYIVFADNDCWMVRQPAGVSWVNRGIEILESDPDVFIVSPKRTCFGMPILTNPVGTAT
jgi:hypothetical protein